VDSRASDACCLIAESHISSQLLQRYPQHYQWWTLSASLLS